MSKPKAVEKLSFEVALSELEDIVSELEQGEAPLDESIARFERGVALSRRCEDRLNEAEKKLALLIKQGTRVVEVDMESGETLSETEDPGDDVVPTLEAEAPTPEGGPEAPDAEAATLEGGPEAPEADPKGSASDGAQQSLIGGLDDDDIPF